MQMHQVARPASNSMAIYANFVFGIIKVMEEGGKKREGEGGNRITREEGGRDKEEKGGGVRG